MRLGGLAAMDRLQQLIFSFYREDPELQERLEPLRSCRMCRSWGSIRIECIDDAHLEELSGLVTDLRLPLAALGMGAPDRVAGSRLPSAGLPHARALSHRSAGLRRSPTNLNLFDQ